MFIFLLAGCSLGKDVSTSENTTTEIQNLSSTFTQTVRAHSSVPDATPTPTQTKIHASQTFPGDTRRTTNTRTPSPTSKPTLTPSITPSPTLQPSTDTSTPTSPVTKELASYWIAFANWRPGVQGIDMIRADGSDYKKLTGDNVWDYYTSPAWSPDGEWIAYSRSHNDSDQLYILNVKDGSIYTLTSGPGYKSSPSWSPDGLRIVYNESHNNQVDIYIINRDGTGRKALAASALGEFSPAWSPDGQMIAYYQQHQAGEDAKDIYVMKADGTKKKRVVGCSTWGSSRYAWSPDSQHIVFQSPDDCRLYIIHPDGKGLEKLENAPKYAANPVWSPDGKYIAFDTNNINCGHVVDRQIYIIRVGGGEPIQVTSDPGWYAIEPAWSPIVGLQVGKGYIITEAGANLNLRKNPSLQAEVVKKLQKEDPVLILEGPVDADGYTWWRMRTEEGIEGWAVEVAGWYAPVSAEVMPTLTPTP